MGKQIKETIPFTIVMKRIKYLEINLPKETKDKKKKKKERNKRPIYRKL